MDDRPDPNHVNLPPEIAAEIEAKFAADPDVVRRRAEAMGRPDPVDVIADAIEAWHDEWSGENYTFHEIASSATSALTAAGYRLVHVDGELPIHVPTVEDYKRFIINLSRHGKPYYNTYSEVWLWPREFDFGVDLTEVETQIAEELDCINNGEGKIR